MGLTAARGQRQFERELRRAFASFSLAASGCSSAVRQALPGRLSPSSGEHRHQYQEVSSMLSLRFLGSGSRFASESSSQRCFRATGILGVAALVGALGCGNDDDSGDGPGTVALADSGSVAELTNEIGIPTTVAVANGVAWVV